MSGRPIPQCADNQAGFAPKSEYHEIPDELSSRDLWDAFNRAWRDGGERPEGIEGRYYVIVEDGIAIKAYRPSSTPGAHYGLEVIAHSVFTHTYDFELENGVRVVWEKGISVRQVRGILR